MPIYEYECKQCGRIEEALQKFSDKPLAKCRHCSGKLTKLISRNSFHLKGTGWYVTDYTGKSKASDKPANENTKKDASPKKTESSKKSDS